MGKLIYAMNVSLDGFVETPDHGLDWSISDDEMLAWWTDQARANGAVLYGRRLYKVMAAYWPTAESDPQATATMLEFARVWNATPKIVFSNSLGKVERNSRLVRGDVGEILGGLRREIDGDLAVGGPTLASAFVRCGLVDEYRLVVHPVILGAGTPFLPGLERPSGLRLTGVHQFASGAVYLGYAAA
jgi:dihydrofolate reductase